MPFDSTKFERDILGIERGGEPKPKPKAAKFNADKFERDTLGISAESNEVEADVGIEGKKDFEGVAPVARKRSTELPEGLSPIKAAGPHKGPIAARPPKGDWQPMISADDVVQTGERIFRFGGDAFTVPKYSLKRELTTDERLELAKRGTVTPQEINQLAKEYGVDSPEDIEQLKDLVTYFGVNVPGHLAPAHAVVGFLGDSLAFGVPQKITIEQWMKDSTDERVPHLLSDLRQLALRRKTGPRRLAEAGTSMLLPLGTMTKPSQLAGISAAMSGTYMGATAPKGREFDEAVKGAVGGGLLGYGIGRLGQRLTYGVTGKSPGDITNVGEAAAAETINRIANEAPKGARANIDRVSELMWKNPRNVKQHEGLMEVLDSAIATTSKRSDKTDLLSIDRFTDALNSKPDLMASFINSSQLGKLKEKLSLLDGATGAERTALMSDPMVSLVVGEGFTPKQVTAFFNYSNKMNKFIRSRGPDITPREFVKWADEQSMSHVRNVHRLLAEGEQAKKQLTRLLDKDLSWNEIRQTLSKAQDVHTVLRQFDQKYGSSLESTLAQLSDNLKSADNWAITFNKRFQDLRKQYKKAGLTDDDVGLIMETKNAAPSKLDYMHVTPKGKLIKREFPIEVKKMDEQLYRDMRKLWDDAREMYNREYSANIPKFETKTLGYFPSSRLDAINYAVKINPRIENLLKDSNLMKLLDTTSNKAWATAKKDERVQFLLNEMKEVRGLDIKKSEDFVDALHQLTDPNRVTEGLNTRATAMMSRDGASKVHPQFRDFNAANVFNNYITGTLKHLAVRDQVAELAKFQRVIKDKDSFAWNYINNLRKDLVGTRMDTVPYAFNWAERKLDKHLRTASTKLREDGHTVTAALVEGARYAPEVIKVLPAQLYPNLIGGSIRSATQNAVSAYLQSLPELGNRYGGEVLGKVLKKTGEYIKNRGDIVRLTPEVAAQMSPRAGNRITLNERNARLLGMQKGDEVTLNSEMASRLAYRPGEEIRLFNPRLLAENARAIGPKWAGEMQRAMTNASKDSTAWRLSQDGLDKANSAMMYLFTLSENYARIQTKYIADTVADDVIRGAEGALKWLDGVSSPAFRSKIAKARRAGDADEVRHLTNQYFQSSNMFNYDRANLSAWGRWGGPVVSTFTKWPSAMAGKMTHELIDRGGEGARKALQQFVAPFAVLQAVDTTFLPEPGVNPLVDLLVGKGQLSNMAGVSSIFDFVNFEQGVLNSPTGQALKGIVKATKSDYEGATGKALQRAGSMFLPGAGMLRVIGEDVPRAAGEDVGRKYPHTGRLKRQMIESERLWRNLRNIPENVWETAQQVADESRKMVTEPKYAKEKIKRAITPGEKYREKRR